MVSESCFLNWLVLGRSLLNVQSELSLLEISFYCILKPETRLSLVNGFWTQWCLVDTQISLDRLTLTFLSLLATTNFSSTYLQRQFQMKEMHSQLLQYWKPGTDFLHLQTQKRSNQSRNQTNISEHIGMGKIPHFGHKKTGVQLLFSLQKPIGFDFAPPKNKQKQQPIEWECFKT